MSLRLIVFIVAILSPSVLQAQLSFGSATRINEGWRFSLSDDPLARQAEYDDARWQPVTLPHDWSVKEPLNPELASCTGYLPGGIGWYRKSLTIPAQSAGERFYLYFEGVYNRSEVYLNGHLLGKRPNGYISFYYDATPYVRPGGENILAVRVDHSRSADSRWYSGSGIYRNVYLVRAGNVHIAPRGVFARTAEAQGERAAIAVDTEVQNHSTRDETLTVRHELAAADGTVVATAMAALSVGAMASQAVNSSLEVSAPRRWSVDDPYLYRLKTTVIRDDQVIDETITRTGLRTFTFDPNRGFFLNGVAMKMKGVCLHHDAGVLGAAVPREVWKARLQTLKSIGCNAIRTSHNPQAPDLYELCDELGLLVLDEAFDEWEFPKRKWLRGWNVGKPGYEGSSDFFEEWSSRDVADMVRRDRNHPSIFAWSIGNEVDYPNDPYSHPVLDGLKINQPTSRGYKPDQPDAHRLGAIAKRLAAEVRKHDASRPVTAALAGVVMSNETAYPAALDIVGYNYTEDRYTTDHAKYPERVIYGSENTHTLKAWKAVTENDHIFGQFLWTGIDYLGEARAWPSRGFYSGLLDFSGAIKPRGRFREALWSNKPVAFLGTEPMPKDDKKSIDAWPVWNYEPGTPVRVLCYTNAAQAQLILNGKPIGEPKAYDRETGVIAWDLAYEPGRLEVIAMDERGAETSRNALRSSGAPATFQLKANPTTLHRDAGVSIVSLQVVDAEGIAVMTSEDEVTCTIDGPGRLLGLEAGNNADMSDYTDAVHKVYRGRMIAYVQSTGEPGELRVNFTAAGLPAGSVSLVVE